MKIAICNPDRSFTEKIKKIIYRYGEEYRLELVADCYSSGEALLESRENYSIIFLSCFLLGMNGLACAECLRAEKINIPIVFISDNTDFILDAFKVNAYRFLLKNDLERELPLVLNDFFRRGERDYPMLIKSVGEITCVNTEDIYYLEANNKSCYIHLKCETLNCNRTMAQVYAALPKHFSKTNRAFVVNLNYISRYNNDMIKLKNGETLYPSRNYYKSFKEDFRRYIRPYEL